MQLLTTLVFTIHIISSTVETLSKHCSDLECNSNEDQPMCIQVIEKGQRPLYVPMNGCAMKELKCNLEDDAKFTIVKMSMCFNLTQTMNQRRAESIEENDTNKETLDSAEPNQEPCPTECTVASEMVCARCSHGVYRSFLSACHMRMYQCTTTNEKLELVSRRACYGSAPYVMPKNGLQNQHIIKLDGIKEKKLSRVVHEDDFTIPSEQFDTPKPTVHVKWPSKYRSHTPKPTVPVTMPTRKRRTPTRKPRPVTKRTVTRAIPTTLTSPTTEAATTTEPTQPSSETTPESVPEDDIKNDITRVDVDICPDDEDQDSVVNVPNECPNSTGEMVRSDEYMKVDLHPDFIEDGSPVWMVFNKGKKITSAIRSDAGLVVGCVAYAGLDYSGTVVVRNRKDDDFLGLVFGYRSNRQFYVVTWKAKSDKYWRGWPSVVTADAGLHIKLVNSKTGPSAYLRNALYSTKSVKDQVTLLWQDPKKQGWKHLIMYNWQLIHRPHIGLIRVKVFRAQTNKLIVDSGNIFDKTIKGGRIGVFAFSQESIEWLKMNFTCNDKIPSNLMSELPSDLQKISVKDTAHKWINDSSKVNDLRS